MEYSEIEKLLQAYNITSIEELQDILELSAGDCDDRNEDNMKNLCLEKKCFATGIPFCRRLIEIYEKFYKQDYPKKHEFVSYLLNKTESSESSIKNWLSCKQCKQDTNGEIVGKVNNSFIQEICKQLKINLNYENTFKKEYRSIKIYRSSLLEVTKENFIPKVNKDKKEESMKQEERDKLYDMIHVSRSQLELNLSDVEKTQGSCEYRMNLALYAFERNLSTQALALVNSLTNSEEFKNNIEYLQLHAKLLSNLEQDDKAIKVLERLIEIQKPSIDVESYNLLAASIKRKGINDYFDENNENNENQEKLYSELQKSKDIYSSIYKINKDYYPAINIIYLSIMLINIESNNKEEVDAEINKLKELWVQSNINDELIKKNWWTCISDVEYLILIADYENALIKLGEYMSGLSEEEISDFSISSTIRQVELYKHFCTDSELGKFILELKKMNSKKHISRLQ